jgi:hypothetical protein
MVQAGAIGSPHASPRSIMILTEIHGMTASVRMNLLLSTDFGNANSLARGSHALKPVTSAPLDHGCWFDQHHGVIGQPS